MGVWMQTDTTDRTLKAVNIVHRFGGVLALDHVNLDVSAGEVHALLGENGAGKSTLVKVLTGALSPDSGEIVINGTTQTLRSPRLAQELGISVVHQDFHLFDELSVSENIFAATRKPPRRLGIADRRSMNDQSQQLLSSLGITIDPRAIVGDLDAAERKLVEIGRALLGEPGYLLLDEPTAALEPRETVRLLGVVERLRDTGTGVILITHRLGEVLDVADSATVLRNGVNVGTRTREELDLRDLAELIVGEDLEETRGPTHQAGDTVLKLRGLRLRKDAAPVEISVGSGEIVAVIGLIGSGVSATLNEVAGARHIKGAEVELDGQWRVWRTRRAAQAAGIGAVPIDRKASGLILDSSIAGNVGMASLGEFSTLGFTARRKLRRAAEDCQRVFDIRCQSVEQPVRALSGGNQQKVMLGRWHVKGSRILVIQEPTQGVDIGARQEIHHYLAEFAERGGSVLFSSSDLEEVRTIAQRIYVMHAGEVVAQFDNTGSDSLSRSELTQAMAGTSMTAHEKEVFE